MFKRFKIVQNWYRPTHCVFRVYERECLFIWKWVDTLETLEKAQQYIDALYAREKADREWEASIPKPKVVETR